MTFILRPIWIGADLTGADLTGNPYVNGYNVSRSWLKTLTKSGRIEALMGSEPSPFTYLYFVLTFIRWSIIDVTPMRVCKVKDLSPLEKTSAVWETAAR